MNGYYLLGDDAVVEWASVAMSTLRRHEPHAEVLLIPFGGPNRLISQVAETYGIGHWEDMGTLEQWDELGAAFFADNVVGQRLFRKLATFDGPYQSFVFLDCDVLVRQPLSWLLTELAQSDSQLLFADEDVAAVYTGALAVEMQQQYGARGWNTGVWAANRGALSLEMARSLLADGVSRKGGFAPTGEQPFFNFLIDEGGIRADRLTRGDRPVSALMMLDRPDDSPVYHWAGWPRPTVLMPRAGVWLAARVRVRPVELRRLIRVLLASTYRVMRRKWNRGAREEPNERN